MIRKSLLLLAGLAVYAATPVYITDTIRSPVNSRPYKGTVTITMSTVLTCGVDSFIKDVAPVKVTDGIIALTLMPNDACTPAGSSYSVRYEPPLGAITTETWVVPTSDVPLKISAVRSAVPATVPTAVPIALTALASGGASMDQALCWSGSAWGPGDCGGGAGTWGSIIGTLSSQTDLQTALNAKQASITSSTDLTARDATLRSITVGDGSTAGHVDACTADELACASVLAPVDAGSEPTCDATARGAQLFVQGGTGVADTIKTCMKAADGTFSWKTHTIS